ncbi:autotransporter outer membrane beta-barrel domain-containing protein [Poriferisphaera sp. WC338]|uniref:autotransporter outer membrane beta-barrel domain-containing protein n=1 Tax=Poriferisphaera sp. WC338 TaxID=3425129 RepID=UPI003D81AAC8
MMLAMQAQETLEQQQETARFTGAEKDIWGAWVNGFGTFGDYDSTSSQAGYNFNTGGVTFGFDYRVLDTLAAGAFVGYSNTGVTVDNGQGTNSFNSINTGMYMTWFNEQGFYASGLFGGGVNFYENNRRIRFGTVDHSDIKVQAAGSRLTVRINLQIHPLRCHACLLGQGFCGDFCCNFS